MSGIGLITNPFARGSKKDSRLNARLWYLLGNQGVFKETKSLSELSDACESFASQRLNQIAIVGGDGSIGLCLTQIAACYHKQDLALPEILILRGGTVNVMAQNLGIFGSPEEILKDYLAARSHPELIDRVSFPSLCAENRLGFLYADGLAAQFLGEFYKEKGHGVKAALLLGKALTSAVTNGIFSDFFPKMMKPRSLALEVDSTPSVSQTNNSMILVSTLPKMPFGPQIFTKIVNQECKAEILTFEMTQSMDYAKGLFQAFMSGSFTSSDIKKFEMHEKVTFKFQEIPWYSLDGELIESESSQLKIEVGPVFTFCSPYRNTIDRVRSLP